MRAVARRLLEQVDALPIVSPHGHTDPRWFAEDEAFADPASLLVTPDHYLHRMLYSQGVPLERLGARPISGDDDAVETDPRLIWRSFARHFHLFRGTPSAIWLDHVLGEVCGVDVRLDADSADAIYDLIDAALAAPAFRPRALFERFRIEALATTDAPTDELSHHQAIRSSGWPGRVVPTFRPDPVIDPEFEGFAANVRRLSELTGRDAEGYRGYLDALRDRRRFFKSMGATATDHGHPTAATADLSEPAAEALFDRVLRGDPTPADAELFRAHLLTVMAGMSLEDGLVMQIHPGSFRYHHARVFARLGRDRGADIPVRTDYVRALKPLLDRHGGESGLAVILFTPDESAYARELAPLAGHHPALRSGPAWWFHDSPEGMRRFRRRVTETAGFYNTVGFNDETRAFLSIPARHDMARRIDCGFRAPPVGPGRARGGGPRRLCGGGARHLSVPPTPPEPRMTRLLATAALAAAAVPLVPRAAPAPPAPAAWPAAWEGRPLTPVAPAPEDERLARGFPGRIARFTDGRRQVVLRRVAEPTRQLHPARDCFGALGYRITPLPMRRVGMGYSSCFEARRADGTFRVCERIINAAGGSFPDASSWYWPALFGRSPGPWLAATVVERTGT